MDNEQILTPERGEQLSLRVFDADQGYLSAASRRWLFNGENHGRVNFVKLTEDWYVVPVQKPYGYTVSKRGMVRTTKLLRAVGWTPDVAATIRLEPDKDEDTGKNVLKLGDIE